MVVRSVRTTNECASVEDNGRMARVVFNTLGSWGDLFPLLPIAAEMRRRGHHLTFAVPSGFVEVCEGEGFEAVAIAKRATIADRTEKAARYDVRPRSPLAVRRLWQDFVLAELPEMVEGLEKACRDADVLVAHPSQQAPPIVHERTGIPWVTASMILGMMPSRHTIPQGTIRHPFKGRLGRAANSASWSVGKAAIGSMLDGPTNAARRRAGAPPRRHAMFNALSPQLRLWLSSPVYQRRPPDWPEHVRQVGFTYFDAPKAWSPPDDLLAFVDQPEPFVIFTLGFSAAMNAGSFFDVAHEAWRALGMRAVFLGGWTKNIESMVDSDYAAWTYAPVSALLPRASAIVHAGGYGTTSHALRHGVPQVVVPWGFDQLFHGDSVEALGVGTVLPRRKLTAVRLARRLVAVLQGEAIKEKVRVVSEELKREGDGSARASDEIEHFLGPDVADPIGGRVPSI